MAGTVGLKGSAMTAEVSQQVKRKKKKEQERNTKRRKLEEEVTRSNQRTSQGATGLSTSSQQVSGNRQWRLQAGTQPEAMFSSQVLESQLTTASQPLPGAYGRRPPKRLAGRRARRAGF